MFKKNAFLMVVILVLSMSISVWAQSPIELKAPWSPGERWSLTGSYYNQGYHNDPWNMYAADFNWGVGQDDKKKPILAMASGSVKESGCVSGLGNRIVMDHDIHDGGVIETVYAHFIETPFVVKNEYVKQGQVLGICGATGGDYSPHLHLGFWVNGEPRYPQPLYIGEDK